MGMYSARMTMMSVEQHHIPLVPGTGAIKLNPYRQGFEKEIEAQVQKLKELDLIEEGHGAFSFPVVLVKKKDGSWRFCVDYRKLNAVTLKDAYPLPRVDDSLDALGGSKWFTTLDMTSGYWQISMDQEARERSAFVTRSGLWQWKVLPFGLTSAPSTFERLMETTMRGQDVQTHNRATSYRPQTVKTSRTRTRSMANATFSTVRLNTWDI